MPSSPGRVCLAAAIVLLLTVPCSAQRVKLPSSSNEFAPAQEIMAAVRGRDARYLRYEAVRKELQITATQFEEMQPALRDLAALRETELDLRSGTPDEARERFQAFRKRVNDAETRAKAVLTDAQKLRLRQIERQLGSFAILSSSDVVAELKISDDQLRQMKMIADDFMRDYVEFQRTTGGGRERWEETIKRRDELEAQALMKTLAVLTAPQQKQWREMLGEKIGFDRMALSENRESRPAPNTAPPPERNAGASPLVPSRTRIGISGYKTLLASEEVRQEIKLTVEQMDQIEKLFREGVAGPEDFNALRKLEEEERRKRAHELQARTEAAVHQAWGLLTDDQRRRFKEVYAQFYPIPFLLEPDVVDRLKLAADQTADLKTLDIDEGKRTLDMAMKIRGRSSREINVMCDEFLKETTALAVAILTPEQKVQFEKMKGAKVAFGTHVMMQFRDSGRK
jgi:hypothetical protein